jgi:hypothetical protein
MLPLITFMAVAGQLFAAAAVSPQRAILDTVLVKAEGEVYNVREMGIPFAENPIFISDVAITITPEGASLPTATIPVGESGDMSIVTLEAVHILPDEDQQLAVCINSGGNDIVASCGAKYYAINKGHPQLLLAVEWGDPQASDVDGNGVQEIVTAAEYWGQFLCHAECIPYLDAIYGYNNGKLVKKTQDYHKYIELDKGVLEQYEQTSTHIQTQGKSYGELGDEERQDLFRSAVAALLAYRDCWQREEATQWWQANAYFLSNYLDAGRYGEMLLELEPGKGRLWNGEDYTLVR